MASPSKPCLSTGIPVLVRPTAAVRSADLAGLQAEPGREIPERAEKDKGIRDSVSSRATCCLLGVQFFRPQPVAIIPQKVFKSIMAYLLQSLQSFI